MKEKDMHFYMKSLRITDKTSNLIAFLNAINLNSCTYETCSPEIYKYSTTNPRLN